MNVHLMLRAQVHPLRVTSVEATEDDFPGSIWLCEQLCWAAALAELEQVELCNLIDGSRCAATILVGRPGEVRIPEGDVLGFEPGTLISVTARVTMLEKNIPHHAATVVLADQRRNAPIEIRRPKARRIESEPSFSPSAKRRTEISLLVSDTPGESAHE